MDAKEFLSQAYRLDLLISEETKELQKLRSISVSLRSPGFEQHYNPNRPTEAPFIRSLEKVWDTEEYLKKQLKQMTTLKAQILHAISELSDPDERLVLKYRFLDGLTYDQIGARLHMDRSTAFRTCDRALDHIKVPEDAVNLHPE